MYAIKENGTILSQTISTNQEAAISCWSSAYVNHHKSFNQEKEKGLVEVVPVKIVEVGVEECA